MSCDIDYEGLQILEKKYLDNFYIYKIDISSFEEVDQLFKNLESKKIYPNCLINNTGIYPGKHLFDYNQELIDKVININIKGSIYFSKTFGKYLIDKKENGVIINMSSVAGEEGSSDAVYGLTKSALIGLTKSCAMNFSPYIRVNAIAPGLVKTDMIKNVPEWRLKEYKKNELIKEPIQSENIADTALFLLSDLFKNYTGVVFDINNGCYLR